MGEVRNSVKEIFDASRKLIDVASKYVERVDIYTLSSELLSDISEMKALYEQEYYDAEEMQKLKSKCHESYIRLEYMISVWDDSHRDKYIARSRVTMLAQKLRKYLLTNGYKARPDIDEVMEVMRGLAKERINVRYSTYVPNYTLIEKAEEILDEAEEFV